MPRPKGRRNADFAEKKQALALAALPILLDERGQAASMAALAEGCRVTVPTLKHYFGDYDGVVEAALEGAEVQGQRYIDGMRDPGRAGLATSLSRVAESMEEGWDLGLGALFEAALTHGLGHASRGRAAVDHVLEPTLQSLEARLEVHRARGQLDPNADARVAALAFLSPLLMALLHQKGLSGSECRPLDVPAFRRQHIERWVAAYGA